MKNTQAIVKVKSVKTNKMVPSHLISDADKTQKVFDGWSLNAWPSHVRSKNEFIYSVKENALTDEVHAVLDAHKVTILS